MARLFIMCGLPFAGKTYVAHQIADKLDAVYIGFDKLWVQHERELPTDKVEGWGRVRQLAQAAIREQLQAGHDVVYDDINIRHDHRTELSDLAEELGASAIIVYLDTPPEVRKQRMHDNSTSHSRHDVETENLDKADAQFEEPAPPEQVWVYRASDDLNDWLERVSKI